MITDTIKSEVESIIFMGQQISTMNTSNDAINLIMSAYVLILNSD